MPRHSFTHNGRGKHLDPRSTREILLPQDFVDLAGGTILTCWWLFQNCGYRAAWAAAFPGPWCQVGGLIDSCRRGGGAPSRAARSLALAWDAPLLVGARRTRRYMLH